MKSKISNEFNFAVVSDIHLGSKRNTTEEIIANLNREFADNQKFADLDLLVLAGDVFDSFLSSIDVLPIMVWASRLIRLCKKHDVMLRILEGTPSHDWKQPVIFKYINDEIANLDADVQYIKDLSIWYEEKFDMNFLFVPDEWSPNAEQTLDQIRDLLKKKGLDQVDYAYLHGNFSYQLPSFVKAPKHDESEYLKIVKHLIFIGHVHTYSNFDRIYAQGSFDRLSHGEEEPKGYIRVRRLPDNFHEVKFIENKEAKKFITITLDDSNLEQSFQTIEERVGDLPHGSYVRIKADEDHPIFTNMDEILRKFPHCKWSKDPIDKKEIKQENRNEQSDFIPIEITVDNVKELLNTRILNLKINSDVFDRTQYYIDEMIRNGV